MRPSIWDKINTDEVEAKLNQLILQLRGPQDEHIKGSVSRYSATMLARTSREIAFRGIATSDEHLYWCGRLRAEVSFLKGYLPAVAKTFLELESFKCLGGIISSRELIAIWQWGVKPQWRARVQQFVADLKSLDKQRHSVLGKRLIIEYRRLANLALRDAYLGWRVRVEEARSVERFGHLDAGLGPVRNSARQSVAAQPLDIAGETRWEGVCITVREFDLDVEVKGETTNCFFQRAGFAERRTGKAPDRIWLLLLLLARRRGVLPFDDADLPWKSRQNLKQYVRHLRQRLKALIPIEADPFEPTRKTRQYRSRFKICTSEGIQFPTPPDATWESVSISEVQRHVVRFSVKSREVFEGYERSRDGVSLEAAVRETPFHRDYRLWMLGLTEQDGSPDPTGRALLDVLRAGGRITRDAGDQGMLNLGGFLSNFMQINKATFRFSENNRTWTAAFDARSDVPPDSR